MSDTVLNTEGIKRRVSNWVITTIKGPKTQASIAKEWDLDPSYISGLKNMKESIGFAVIERILNYDIDLNARWLMVGDGEMYEPKEGRKGYKFRDKQAKLEMDELVLSEKPVKYQTNTGLIETAQKALESLIDTTYELEEVKGTLAECERENNELKAKLTKLTQGK